MKLQRGKRRGPRRMRFPSLGSRARRATGNDWFAVFEYGVRDPRGLC